jgi:hypothetical protein
VSSIAATRLANHLEGFGIEEQAGSAREKGCAKLFVNTVKNHGYYSSISLELNAMEDEKAIRFHEQAITQQQKDTDRYHPSQTLSSDCCYSTLGKRKLGTERSRQIQTESVPPWLCLQRQGSVYSDTGLYNFGTQI